MDYFHVGNHIGNVSLEDLHGTIGYKNDRCSAKLVPHVFSAATDIYNRTTKMFATNSMEFLKGGDRNENNS
jgi:hypothetical protein